MAGPDVIPGLVKEDPDNEFEVEIESTVLTEIAEAPPEGDLEPTPKEPEPAALADGGGDGDGEGDEVEDGEDTSDLGDVSQNVRKRIMRERRLKRRAEEDAAAAAAAAVASRQQANMMQVSYGGLLVQTLTDRIEIAQSKLRAAIDSGNAEEEASLHTQISKLTADRSEAEQLKGRIEEEARRPVVNPLTVNWKNRNRWFGDPEFAAESAAVREIDQAVAASGFNQFSREYWIELDKRLGEKFPKLRSRVSKPMKQSEEGNGAKAQQRQQPRQTVAGGQPTVGGGVPATRGGKVVLSRQHLENMRTFGLDPGNKEHLKEYARQVAKGGSR